MISGPLCVSESKTHKLYLYVLCCCKQQFLLLLDSNDLPTNHSGAKAFLNLHSNFHIFSDFISTGCFLPRQ